MPGVGIRNEHPIIFSREMVRAILNRRKTQTRRVIQKRKKDGGRWFKSTPTDFATPKMIRENWPCPFGQPGDRLWVRETIDLNRNPDNPRAVRPTYRADGAEVKMGEGFYKFPKGPTCPSIFMPRWASRIILEVEDAPAKRLHDITTGGRMFLSDVEKEGCPRELASSYDGDPMGSDEIAWFINLWDSINAKRGFGWDINPWVRAITFKRVLKP